MIRFDALPTENPGGGVPKPGIYRATINKAEMKAPKDPSKKEYLSITLKLRNKDESAAGTVFDILTESEAPAILYKIGRFLRACGIPLQGAMELKDIAKLVLGKEVAVDIKNEKDTNGNDRAVVDLFTREAYYMPGEFDHVYELLHADEAPKDYAGVANNVPEAADGEEEVAY